MPLTQPMRRPTRGRRPGKILMENPSQEELLRAAEAARYVSSPYHRPARSPMGPALHRPFPHASKCPTSWDLTGATRALKEAIRTGCVSAEWRGAVPRVALFVGGGVLYGGVCV